MSALPVCFVIFQAGRQSDGGLESITQILEHLTEVRPIVVTQLESPFTERWRRLGADVRVISAGGRPSSSPKATRALAWSRFGRKLHGVLRTTGARVVHCNDISGFFHAAPAARAARAHLVLNVRSVKTPDERYGAKWRLARWLASDIVCLSGEMERAVQARTRLPAALGPGALFTSIPSIVDLDRYRPATATERVTLRRALGIAQGAFVVAYVGAVTSRKGQLEFLRQTVPALLSAVETTEVHFVGDFDPSEAITRESCEEALAGSSSSARVRFHGFRGDAEGWYRAADVTALASRREGLARCMIESLACGVPVASFEVCSAREILSCGPCGVVVPMGRFDLLTDSLVALHARPEWRRRLGARGAELARERFGADRNARSYEALYRSRVAA